MRYRSVHRGARLGLVVCQVVEGTRGARWGRTRRILDHVAPRLHLAAVFELVQLERAVLAVDRGGLNDGSKEMCLFLADGAKSGFVTGQQFVVDGGVTCKMIYPE